MKWIGELELLEQQLESSFEACSDRMAEIRLSAPILSERQLKKIADKDDEMIRLREYSVHVENLIEQWYDNLGEEIEA